MYVLFVGLISILSRCTQRIANEQDRIPELGSQHIAELCVPSERALIKGAAAPKCLPLGKQKLLVGCSCMVMIWTVLIHGIYNLADITIIKYT